MVGPTVRVANHPTRDGLALVTLTGLRKMPEWTFRVTVQPPTPGRSPEVLAVEHEPPAGKRITAEVHRRIPIGEVIRLAEGAFRTPMLALVAEALGAEASPRPYRGSVEHLKAVAGIYRYGLSQGIPPRDAVAEVYAVHDKTVQRWLAEARRTTDPDTGRPVLGTHEAEQAKYGLTARERQQIREADRRLAARARRDRQLTEKGRQE